MTKSNDRVCPHCGEKFSPTDPSRKLCIECHLAAKDARRAKEGPTKIDHTIKGVRTPLNVKGGRVIRKSYDDRITDGFDMMGSENE